MSTINSSSTLAQLEAAYDDNCSYAEDNSPAKCRTFMTACRMLLRRYPRMVGTGQNHTHFNPDLLQKELETAQEWLEANDTGSPQASGPRITRTSFEQFREF